MSGTEVGAAGRTMDKALVEIDGEGFYAVPDVDQMPPFLMSVVSDGDRWMFVSSSGALTAGRADTSGALFPYETDDRLHQSAGLVVPCNVHIDNSQVLYLGAVSKTKQSNPVGG